MRSAEGKEVEGSRTKEGKGNEERPVKGGETRRGEIKDGNEGGMQACKVFVSGTVSWLAAAFPRCEVGRPSLESHNHHHVTDSVSNRLNLHRCANVGLQTLVQSEDDTGRHKSMAANQLRVPCHSLCFCDFLFYFEVLPSCVVCRFSFPPFVWFPFAFLCDCLCLVCQSALVCIQPVCSLSVTHLSLISCVFLCHPVVCFLVFCSSYFYLLVLCFWLNFVKLFLFLSFFWSL